jgi:hypothetical protein
MFKPMNSPTSFGSFQRYDSPGSQIIAKDDKYKT